MKTSLIIHGHFYQPPRENPYTGIIPYQETPGNCGNWNEEIYRTCYLPNAYSRYLDFTGKIEEIVNNYCYISSNFGPTLLKWMDDAHPEFIKKLREADNESLERTGHSNILAQCYNHTILPLENRRTKETEVKWAIEDYTYRFGHKPEGFWLAECAIDKATIDVLSENGITYVVLSPWQAVAIDSVPLKGAPAPCDRPFYIEGNNSRIVAFFYDPDLASGISFGHLLRDADALYEKLVEMKEERKDPALINWATDGEIYGHHEAFGDMALAALIKKALASDDFEFTNYGAFLEKHGVKETAELSNGDDGRGSSWSCSHGVGRWYRDCGCHTGGDDSWNQKWRTPMRQAFNKLEKKARRVFDAEVEKILDPNVSPDSFLEGFGKVLSGRITVASYVKSFKSATGMNLTNSESIILAELLDAMKNCMFSYTSCGWFFNDISGIEPSQCIQYAICCANRIQNFVSTENILMSLLRDLSEAQSNIPSFGTGEDIARKLIGTVPPEVEACAYFLINSRIADKEYEKKRYGLFKLVSLNKSSVTVKDTLILDEITYTYEDVSSQAGTLSLVFRSKKTGYSYTFSSNSIPRLMSYDIRKWLNSSVSMRVSEDRLLKLSSDAQKFMFLFSSDSSKASNDMISSENAAVYVKIIKSYLRNPDNMKVENLKNIWPLISFVKVAGRISDVMSIKNLFDRQMNYYAELASRSLLTEKNALDLITVLSSIRSEEIHPDITLLQNEIYPVLTGKKETKISKETLLQLRKDLNFTYWWC
ncbi:MAG: DUF3536 domain-containing protein [Sphaerochaetaceae bacterium]|nr:DUF3536 domain-containing protein [Sphaerochaetaceae bacterium]